ncbi:RagB/SusD family nutrient uptake outer membrane protein [Flavobacterium quisquiliarum]|uniref:RagB/SusD family nutrient uptake outer membrane protein n=1 Tax=Flavobacterium quisquiliarum TaxID=1834436 RepID=A0ABV8WEX1_9FLAO|nr:RagB/SusD family nutrient uptake outer membrane protein [Flavobacterium quisquiliarum]MBW1657781.1 RagB/SusD family nutrient uptake outer membrane protein [Flavobacterium quisquiliarum]NWL04120.1 RagB/SusD family nutrient uptake outer membrane protein [Flavobacterium collinsii]
MKNLNLILGVITVFTFFGCSSDFLESQPTEVVTDSKIAEIVKIKPEALNAILSGIYTTMYTPGMGGTTSHDDFGQKGFDIYTDMLCSDMVLAGTNYGYYTAIVRYQSTVNFTDLNNYKPWRYYYRVIFSANQIIEAFGGNDVIPENEEGKHILGQAKALRAYGYFYLAQLFQKGYNADELILPIYTDTKVPNQPKSAASKVYDLIIKDLTDSISLLETYNRDNKSSINKAVAQGLLAYTYGAQGNYQKVRDITSDIIAQNNFPLTTENQLVAKLDGTGKLTNPESGFNNVATPSWMWGVDLTTATDLDLISWWGQIDYYTYSYAYAGDPKTMDSGLQSKITASDIRKGQFNSTGRPLGKFFDTNRVPGGQRIITTDYVYMRIEEMYLLNAEAKAMLGDDLGAKTILKQLFAIRKVDSAYLDALSGTALQKEIYLQTRIEFWGEGKSYLAMKRNKATTTRGSNHLFMAGESFQYDDPRLTFVIPQAEVLNNPVL